MAMEIKLPKRCSGKRLIATLRSMNDTPETGRDWQGTETGEEWRWRFCRYTQYDGFAHYTLQHRYIFFGPMEWDEEQHEASGPALIVFGKIEPTKSYSTLSLRVGRRLDGAWGYSDGFHEHLEYDDVVWGPSARMLGAKLVALLRSNARPPAKGGK